MQPLTSFSAIFVASALKFNHVLADSSASGSWDCDKFLCRFPAGSSVKPSWNKWDEITDLIVFGASYASAGPESDILDPKPPYKTSCNGPNYIDLLTNGLNKSAILTKSYAIPGSPVSWSVLDNGNVPKDQTNSFVLQTQSFLADKKGKLSDLSAKSTLYHMEFGINDINTAGAKYTSFEASIFEKYQAQFDTLYQNGARNFVVLDVPPIDRSPKAAAAGETTVELWKASVISFNTNISNMLAKLGNKYGDATFFRMGINGLFSSILDNPSSSTATEVYKDTTHTCAAYADHDSNSDPLPSKDYKSPDCTYAVNEYFWFTGYHPTYPMHTTMALEIAEGLQNL